LAGDVLRFVRDQERYSISDICGFPEFAQGDELEGLVDIFLGEARLHQASAHAAPSDPAGSKFLGARAGHQACLQAVLTHGGMGYAKEYQVERLLREVLVTRIAPMSEQMILSFIAEKVLNQPKSY
jgi:alkylation response protein AidB-like acyl-CoA dehydrogenase